MSALHMGKVFWGILCQGQQYNLLPMKQTNLLPNGYFSSVIVGFLGIVKDLMGDLNVT